MGLLSGILGNASEVDADKVEKDLEAILADGEDVQKAFQLIRDLVILTDKRMILVNKQGITGKKKEYLSIPYKSVDYFSVETAGHFDLDAEIKIWLKSKDDPISLEFKRDKCVYDLFRGLSTNVLK